MRTASLALAAAALATLAFALPTVSASPTCTPTNLPARACVATGPAPGQACAGAGMSPQFGYGGLWSCVEAGVSLSDPESSHVCATEDNSATGAGTLACFSVYDLDHGDLCVFYEDTPIVCIP